MMIPYFDSILDKLNDDVNRYRIMGEQNVGDDSIANGAEGAYNKMLKYFAVSSDLAIVATVIDPRFKLEYHQQNPIYREMIERSVDLS